MNYIPHVGNNHEITDITKYNHLISEEIDFDALKEDNIRDHLKHLFSFDKSILIRTSNANWIKNFYLPNLDCDNSREEMILFQSNANSPSYIHLNNDTFQLETNSNVLLKSTNGRWKIIKTPYIPGNWFK